jgi:AcrR family transcriptional regulator
LKTPKAAPAPNDDADAATPMTKTGRQDRRHLRGQASAQRIIDTTIRLIADEGIAGVTMQRIAREIGSSNALVVFHFGSKEKLFRAVLEYLNEQFARLWEETVNAPDLSAAERVVASIDCARHFRHRHADWVSVWVLFGSDRQTMQLDRLISLPSDQAYLAQSRALLARGGAGWRLRERRYGYACRGAELPRSGRLVLGYVQSRHGPLGRLAQDGPGPAASGFSEKFCGLIEKRAPHEAGQQAPRFGSQ